MQCIIKFTNIKQIYISIFHQSMENNIIAISNGLYKELYTFY